MAHSSAPSGPLQPHASACHARHVSRVRHGEGADAERTAATQEGGRYLRAVRVAQDISAGLGLVYEIVVINVDVLLGRDQERSIRHETEVEVGHVAEVNQQLRRPLRRRRQVEPLRLHQ